MARIEPNETYVVTIQLNGRQMLRLKQLVKENEEHATFEVGVEPNHPGAVKRLETAAALHEAVDNAVSYALAKKL